MRPGTAAAGLVLSGSWAGPDRLHGKPVRNPPENAVASPEPLRRVGLPPRFPAALAATTTRTSCCRRPASLQTTYRDRRSHANGSKRSSHTIVAISLAEIVTTATLVLGVEDDMIVPVYLQEELATRLIASQHACL